jgi:hypothetical protein
MTKTNFYVDAFNLYYGCLKGTRDRWLDLDALFRSVFPGNEINRIRYFTATVESRPPDLHQAAHQRAYLRALQTIPNLSIHYGHYKTRAVRLRLAKPPVSGPQTAYVLRTEEKCSDVNLASYLLLDAFRGECQTAIVVSNDADLKTPIEIAKTELGISVGVLNPHPLKRRSFDLQPTFFKQLRRGPVSASHFPSVLKDARGKIRKPPRW